MISPAPVEDLTFREVSTFPSFDSIEHGDLYTISLTANTGAWTHGLHRFPAKFIPQIPAWALREFGDSDATVLDPFVGSGTTLVEAALHGGKSCGVDLDPLARLIAGAKTTPVDPVAVRSSLDEIKRRFRGSRRFDGEAPMKGVQNFHHWFTAQNAAELAEILDRILELDVGEAERRFLLVCFSSCLRWVSNADDQTQKTYVSGTRSKTPPPAFATFWRAAIRACVGLSALSDARDPGSLVQVTAPRGDFGLPVATGSVDLIVTSPPYLDSVDYMYNFMLEYFWLGPLLGVPDRGTFNEMRRKYLGAKSPIGPQEETMDIVMRAVEHGLSLGRGRAVNAYLHGIDRHFKEAARTLRPGGIYVLVAGNSQTRKTILPVHDALLELAAGHGLRLEKAFAYRVRRHYMKFPRGGRGGIILIDWVMVLTKRRDAVEAPEPLALPWATLSPEAVAN